MSTVVISSMLTTPLRDLLMCDSIQPGSEASYQICKILYTYHPLGLKMAESSVRMAQSQAREIAVPRGPEDRLKEAFAVEWEAIGADKHIFNLIRTSRIYGIASLALMEDGVSVDQPVDYKKLYKASISFNVFDPLNTAGSLVLNQNPNAMDFQHVRGVGVQGLSYHRSRTRTKLNEDPIYIEYTTSAFGYVGRSVYQRALFPMKTFVQTMIADDMIARKAGVIVAKMEQPGSIIDNLMAKVGAIKRALLKQAETDNVLEVGKDDTIESLDLTNLEAPATMARKNCIENTATAADMPAKLLLQESFAEGFGEGTEDAKHVAQYVARERREADGIYAWMDEIVMHRAWNPDFYEIIQKEFPEEYRGVTHAQAFYTWKNSFKATWPSLLVEPDSEKIKVDDVKLKAVIGLLEALMGKLDPINQAEMIKWACDNFNELKLMFGTQLNLDFEALADFNEEQAENARKLLEQGGAPGDDGDEREPKFADSSPGRALVDAVLRLPPSKSIRDRHLRLQRRSPSEANR